MRVILCDDPSRFYEAAGEFLRAEPFTTNVIGTQLVRAMTASSIPRYPNIFAAVVDDQRVVGVAMAHALLPCMLSRMPDSAVRALARALSEAGLSLKGASGEQRAIRVFRDAWALERKFVAMESVSMTMYRLQELRPPTGVTGSFRVASEADSPLVLRWLTEFDMEAHPDLEEGRTSARDEERIARGEYLFWLDGGNPVALAARHPPAMEVARVGPVFTPVPRRRRGYGSAATAAVTQIALDLGAKEVALYADIQNATSNRIYQSLGYVADHSAEELIFRPIAP